MKVCMVAYTYYEIDNRVRRYAETLVRRGDAVDVISLKRRSQTGYDKINGVRVYRIQSRVVNEKGKHSYLWRIAKFLVKSGAFLSWKHLQEPYHLIHVHSVPDFEVFAALIPKLKGAKIILDIHDITPEFYCSKFRRSHRSLIYKTLVLLEKYSTLFADHIIVSNHIWHRKLVDRSVTENNSTVILNYPDSSIFYRHPSHRDDGKIIMIYPGTLNWHQGLDIAIKAFDMIKEKVTEAEFHIYGDGPSKPAVTNLIKKLGLERRVLLCEPKSLDDIAAIMSDADIGIVPKRNDSFGGEAFSTKTLEFMALGVPIIVSKTKIDQYYFDDNIVKFFEPENKLDLAEAMLLLIRNKALRQELSNNALKYVAEYTWDKKKNIYLDLIDSLVCAKKL